MFDAVKGMGDFAVDIAPHCRPEGLFGRSIERLRRRLQNAAAKIVKLGRLAAHQRMPGREPIVGKPGELDLELRREPFAEGGHLLSRTTIAGEYDWE